MSKFIPQSELYISPITKNGEPVNSRFGSVVQKQGDKLVMVPGSFLIDSQEIVDLLKWLDEKAPLFYSTPSLERAAGDMRKELNNIWGAIT